MDQRQAKTRATGAALRTRKATIATKHAPTGIVPIQSDCSSAAWKRSGLAATPIPSTSWASSPSKGSVSSSTLAAERAAKRWCFAKELCTRIHAVDSHEPSLSDLVQRTGDAQVGHLVRVHCMDMKDIPQGFQDIDLLWSEGAACNSGAGGLITWTRVGGGSGNWAWAFGSIRTSTTNLPIFKT